jgi:hypothetical protein
MIKGCRNGYEQVQGWCSHLVCKLQTEHMGFSERDQIFGDIEQCKDIILSPTAKIASLLCCGVSHLVDLGAVLSRYQ